MTKSDPRPIATFLTPQDMGARNWGEETLLAVVPGKYSFKKLFIRAGQKGGLQYHHKKNECGYLVSGELLVRYDSGDGKLAERRIRPGESFQFPPGAVHQEEAITDCEIIEVSTPFKNDRVRVEEQYGLPRGDGLPSTTIEEVEEIR